MNVRNRIAAAGAAGAVLLSGAAAFSPADAAPVITGGLVNVTVVDVLSGDQIQVLNGVTLNVAAQVCGVAVNVLATELGPTGTAVCNATSTTITTVTQRR